MPPWMVSKSIVLWIAVRGEARVVGVVALRAPVSRIVVGEIQRRQELLPFAVVVYEQDIVLRANSRVVNP